jgi:simple sugar transport system permease protein
MMRLLKIYMERPALVALLVLLMLTAYFSIISNGSFVSTANLRGILSLYPEIAILALGFGLLMIAGEFDLSVGAAFGLAPMVMCTLTLYGMPFFPALLVGLGCCLVVGLVNAFVTVGFGIPSFITTLGTMFMVRSLCVVLYSSGGAPVLPPDAPTWAFSMPIGFIRVSVIWLVVIALALYVLLERTNFGNWIRATGGSLESAKAMGIPTHRVKAVCFVIASVLAGFAGVIQVVRTGSPLPGLGTGNEFYAIAAAVIGGVSLGGGVGNVLGVIIGLAIIRVIDGGMIISRIDGTWFNFAVGFLIIIAVIGNTWLGQRARAIKVETGK